MKKLEATGIISNERNAPAQITEPELKKLLKTNERLQSENERLRKNNAELAASLREKEQEIAELIEKIQTVKGELFAKHKLEFAQNRI